MYEGMKHSVSIHIGTDGWTALMLAAQEGHIGVTNYLVGRPCWHSLKRPNPAINFSSSSCEKEQNQMLEMMAGWPRYILQFPTRLLYGHCYQLDR